MPNFNHIDRTGAFSTGQKQALKQTFEDLNSVGDVSALNPIVDNTGGTPTNELMHITASDTYSQNDSAVIKDGLTSLAAKYNALLSALQFKDWQAPHS